MQKYILKTKYQSERFAFYVFVFLSMCVYVCICVRKLSGIILFFSDKYTLHISALIYSL